MSSLRVSLVSASKPFFQTLDGESQEFSTYYDALKAYNKKVPSSPSPDVFLGICNVPVPT